MISSGLFSLTASWNDLPIPALLWLTFGGLAVVATQCRIGLLSGASDWLGGETTGLVVEAAVLPSFMAVHVGVALLILEPGPAVMAAAVGGLILGTIAWAGTRASMAALLFFQVLPRRRALGLSGGVFGILVAGLEVVVASRVAEAVRFRNMLCASGRWDASLPFLAGAFGVRFALNAQLVFLALGVMTSTCALLLRRNPKWGASSSRRPLVLLFLSWATVLAFVTELQIWVGRAVWRC